MKKLYKAVQSLGFIYDKESNVIYGYYQGYPIYFWSQNNSGYSRTYVISTSVAKDGQFLSKIEANELRQSGSKSIARVNHHKFRLDFFIKNAFLAKSRITKTLSALDDIVAFLSNNGYVAACEENGQTNHINFYNVSGSPRILSQSTFDGLSTQLADLEMEQAQISENYLIGSVGAFLGSLIGVAAIVIVSQLGYVSMLSGIIMGVCTVKGYQFLAKKFSIISAIICLVIVVVMTYFANELDWAISIANYFQVDIFTAFQGIPVLKADGTIDRSIYFTNLGMLAVFTLITSVATILNALKESQNKFSSRELS
ncbi:hypothetical protein ACVRYP_02210 [Streptococcus rifensis]